MRISVEVEFDEETYEKLSEMADYFEDTHSVEDMLKQMIDFELWQFEEMKALMADEEEDNE